jgi:trimethylguanosine synthase
MPSIILSEASQEEQSQDQEVQEQEPFKLDPTKTSWVMEDIPNELRKYYCNRYSLFSLFEHGIQIDYEGWYSVTPELVAQYLANRFSLSLGCLPQDELESEVNSTKNGNSKRGMDTNTSKSKKQKLQQESKLTVVDAFCGVGGNSIQFALAGMKVIAIDLDPIRLSCAKANAEIYGVSDQITFILGDFFDLAEGLRGDAVFLSPPWGGPEYLSLDVFDIDVHMPFSGTRLYDVARGVSRNVCYFLPRNTDVGQVAGLASRAEREDGNCMSQDKEPKVEFERVWLNDREKCVCVYYGDLVNIPIEEQPESDGGWEL